MVKYKCNHCDEESMRSSGGWKIECSSCGGWLESAEGINLKVYPSSNYDNHNKENQLKQYRESNKLTQAELADILNVDRSFVAQMETGKRPISNTILKMLAVQV